MEDLEETLKSVCRLCFSKKSLTPIFHAGADPRRYSTAIFLISGINVSPDDGYPQKACLNCIKHLNKSLVFRQNCREIDKKLLALTEEKPIKVNKITIIDDIKQKSLPNTVKVEPKDIQIKYEVKIEYDDDDIPLSNIITHDNENTTSNIKTEETQTKFLNEQHIEESEELDKFKDSNKRITCQFCLKTMAYHSLQAHMVAYHAKEDVNRMQCNLCERYVLKSKINRHKKLMHGICNGDEDGAVKCFYCKIKFPSKQELLEHVSSCQSKKKTHKPTDSRKEMTSCNICHKNMQKASLSTHKAIIHAGLGPVCEHCGKIFANKCRLNDHCRSKHGHEKYKCSYCDFQSAGIMAMRNHERRHRGEKPFVCETCGAKFHAGYLLKRHKQSHRTEKLIKCPQCPARFKAKNSLHMHTQKCHSNCFYKCFLCDRTYNCRHYVVKHLRQFHDFKDKVGPLEKVLDDHSNVKIKLQDDANT